MWQPLQTGVPVRRSKSVRFVTGPSPGAGAGVLTSALGGGAGVRSHRSRSSTKFPRSGGEGEMKALRLSLEPKHGKPGEIGVGLCWHIARDGVTRFHDGQTGGYSSCIYAYGPKRMGVVMLANTANSVTVQTGERILQSMLGMKVEPVEFRKKVDLDPAVLARYVGKYSILPWLGFTITLEEGRLMAQLSGQDKHQIFAESPTKFFYKVVDAQITFERSPAGEVTHLILHQNGVDQKATRMPEVK